MNSCNKSHKIDHIFKLADSKLSPEDSKKVKKSQAKLTYESVLPFSKNDSPGLVKFANEMIRIGAKYGNINAQNILFGRKTIANECYILAEKEKQNFIKLIADMELVKKEHFCLTSDLWSSRVGDSYLQIHMLYLKDFEIKVITQKNYYILKNI